VIDEIINSSSGGHDAILAFEASPQVLVGVAVISAAMLATPQAQATGTTAPTNTGLHYAIKDLGTLGGISSNAEATDGDTVVGGANTPSGAFHAFAYNLAHGTMTDLGTLGGTNSRALNVSAVVKTRRNVGLAFLSDGQVGALCAA
jgi:probable HAF family extracellular repeat protein